MKSETELDKLLDHIAFHYPGVPLDAAERELFSLRAREQALVAALQTISDGNSAKNGKWLSDTEMADLARAALAGERDA